MSMLSTQEIVLPHVAYYPSQPKDACIPSSPKFTPFCRSLNLYRLLLLLWLCRCHFICAVDFLCIFLEWHFFFAFSLPSFFCLHSSLSFYTFFPYVFFFLGYFFPIVFLHRRHTHTHSSFAFRWDCVIICKLCVFAKLSKFDKDIYHNQKQKR